MVGVDFGSKPAISLVVPKRRDSNNGRLEANPCIHCEGVDLWPEGELPNPPPTIFDDEDPPVEITIHPWKQYCLRQFVYERASDGTLSNVRVFIVTFVDEAPVYTESSSWYDFDAGFVTDSLADLSGPPPGDCSESRDLKMRVHLLVQFYRERSVNPTPPPDYIPVGDETTSRPNVLQICYSYGINVDTLYAIS